MDPDFVVPDGWGRPSRLGTWIKSPVRASKWLIQKLTARRDNAALPTLPAQRPRPMTPMPADDAGGLRAADPGAAVAHSAFFQRLPAEIRRRILIEAFGEQTVHMDLVYGRPPRPPKAKARARARARGRGSSSGGSHGNLSLYRHGGMDESRVKVRELQPKRWMWRSSVCHRNIPVRGSYARYAEPAQDLCRFGIVGDHICDFWPGEQPTKCCIGAMGWLLTCRQAYVEGVDVLYSTNTVHSASKELLCGIDGFLLPQRLASIRSVELMWEFDLQREFDGLRVRDGDGGSPTFGQFLEAVPTMFPGVVSLYLTVQWRMPWPQHSPVPNASDEELEAGDAFIMRPVDAMVRRLGAHVRDCQVAIPSTMYATRRRQAVTAGALVEQLCLGGRVERYWRRLDDAASPRREGYWVRLGQKDIAFPYHCPTHRNMLAVAFEDWCLFWGT